MKLINIKESGSNNILRWGITNGANIKSDRALQSMVEDHMSYILTIDDINFFELFRLTQMYRNRIRIIEEKKAEMPTRSELHNMFKGTYIPNEEKPDDTVQLCELVEHCGDLFINIAMQMSNDDHIISPSAVRMFLPMISRKFTIQIPLSFMDFIDSMTDDESNQIFNNDYPNTLETVIDTENHGLKIAIQLAMVRATTIIKYEKQYDKYINFIKYSPLKSSNNKNKLFKNAMLGFYKRDDISKKDIRVDLFNINRSTLNNTFKQLAHTNNPLEFEFVIQMPIQYMQLLENYFSPEILSIGYESAMSNIIDGDLSYNDFMTSEYIELNDESEVNTTNNAISAYKMRIAEANQNVLNLIQILLEHREDVDVINTFAMLPSIYTTKAVIRFNMNNANKLLAHYDPMIQDMFKEIIDLCNAIIEDINKTK